MKFNAILVAGILSISPASLFCQVTSTTTKASVLESVREGRVSLAADALAQKGRVFSARELGEIGDGLVGIILSYERGDPPEVRQGAIAAMTVLKLAAQDDRGIPFVGSFQCLVRVFEESPDVGFRGGALDAISQLPARGAVVEFLAEVAQSTDSAMAAVAIRTMAKNTGAAGLARLRRLFEDESVSDPTARDVLNSIAAEKGWKTLEGK